MSVTAATVQGRYVHNFGFLREECTAHSHNQDLCGANHNSGQVVCSSFAKVIAKAERSAHE